MKSRWLFLSLLFIAVPVHPQFSGSVTGWQAGFAKTTITPKEPLWLTGYAARTKPSEGTLLDIYAKAVAFEDQRGTRLVIVTTDLLGIPRAMGEAIAEQARLRYKLSRQQVMLTASHTHTGPALTGLLGGAGLVTPEQQGLIDQYTTQLQSQIVALIGQALADLKPAVLSHAVGTARFGVNRRVLTPEGVKGGVNPQGPVDYDVPVLRIASPEGKLRGVLFGYACHNTTLTGEFYQFSGDYAGFAQAALEREHPGATALFVMGAGADINPNPRSKIEYAQTHGQALADVVAQMVSGSMPLVRGELKLAFDRVPLPFGPMPTRAEWEARTKDENVFRRQHAQRWLARLERDGRLMRDYSYSLQAVQFGNDLRMVVMAGEVVVDYALRLKRELGRDGLWVVAYANDACSYIPSARILKEGGYEASDSMIYYDLPTAYAPDIEERIIGKIHEMLKRLRQERPKKSVW
jgi:neutral ceramidase